MTVVQEIQEPHTEYMVLTDLFHRLTLTFFSEDVSMKKINQKNEEIIHR